MRNRKMNESEETEEIKIFPSTITCYKDSRPCPNVSQYQLDAPVVQDTQHLCLTQPPPIQNMKRFLKLFSKIRRNQNIRDGCIKNNNGKQLYRN